MSRVSGRVEGARAPANVYEYFGNRGEGERSKRMKGKEEEEEEGAQVLYYEVEKDTSCVLNMSDDGVPPSMPKGRGGRH